MIGLTHYFVVQVGSIEGRVAVQHIDEAQQAKNFTFKCHRDNNDIYAVNAINFHPVRYCLCKYTWFTEAYFIFSWHVAALRMWECEEVDIFYIVVSWAVAIFYFYCCLVLLSCNLYCGLDYFITPCLNLFCMKLS